MSYGIRKEFYNSKLWRTIRKNIWLKQNLLCARCGKPVYVDGISDYIPKEYRTTGIVHHKEYLNDINITDDNITISEDNLEGLCIDCHNHIHFTANAIRDNVMFNEYGELVKRE